MDAKKVLSRHAGAIKKYLETHGLTFTATRQEEHSVFFEYTLQPARNQVLPGYIILTHGLVPGHSLHLIMTAVLDKKQKPEEGLDGLGAFLSQLSVVFPALNFLLDFESSQVLMRQNFLLAHDSTPNIGVFFQAVELVAPLLKAPLARLDSRPFSIEDARLMADYLAENCYEVIQNGR